MSLIILAFVIFIAILLNQKVKNDEIKSNNKEGIQSLYKEKLNKSVRSLCIFLGIFLFGYFIHDRTVFLAYLFYLIGAGGFYFSGIAAIRAYLKVKKYRSMSNKEYSQIKEDIIKAEEEAKKNSENSIFNAEPLFEQPPICPRCGSEDTKTSDNYKVKAGAKVLAGVAFGAALGSYTNMNFAQTFVAKQQFKKSIRIAKEYQCKCCGYVWKASPEQKPPTPPKQINNKHLLESPRNNNDFEKELKLYEGLLEDGTLTQEEYNREIDRLFSKYSD